MAVMLLAVFATADCYGGVFYVVSKLVKDSDGSLSWHHVTSILVLEGEHPSAYEQMQAAKAEAAKEPGVVSVRITKESDNEPAVKPSDQSATKTIAKPSDSDAASDRLKQRLNRVTSKVDETLKEASKNSQNDVQSAVKRVQKFAGSYSHIVGELNQDNVREINGLISNYNRMAKELGTGPLAESFSNLTEMKPLSNLDAKAAQERVFAVQAKFEEMGLRLQQRNLAQSKEELEVEAQDISRDKEAGIDVRQREQKLADAVKSWETSRDGFQKQVDSYTQDVAKLDAVRNDIKEENRIAAQKQQEIRRQQQAAEVAEQQRKAAEQQKAQASSQKYDLFTGFYSSSGSLSATYDSEAAAKEAGEEFVNNNPGKQAHYFVRPAGTYKRPKGAYD